MQDNSRQADHVQEFVGKYEETNPLSRYFVNGFYRALEDLIPADIDSIFEAGCGAGYSSEYITRMPHGASYAASDISADLIGLARQRLPGIDFAVESIYALQREDNSVDLAMALETFEHIEDPLAALRELKRVARKYIVLSVPREPLWCALNLARLKYVTRFGNTPGHINHWSKRGFIALVERELPVIRTRSPVPWTMILARVGDA